MLCVGVRSKYCFKALFTPLNTQKLSITVQNTWAMNWFGSNVLSLLENRALAVTSTLLLLNLLHFYHRHCAA